MYRRGDYYGRLGIVMMVGIYGRGWVCIINEGWAPKRRQVVSRMMVIVTIKNHTTQTQENIRKVGKDMRGNGGDNVITGTCAN